MKKHRIIRLNPKGRGIVVRLPLPDGSYAYFCNHFSTEVWESDYYWLFGFVTDRPVADKKFFDPQDWIAPVEWCNLPPTCRDVTAIPLTREQERIVRRYKRLDYIDPIWNTHVIIREPDTGLYRGGTEEEIVGMPKAECFYHDEIIPWIMEHRPKMRLIQGADPDVDRKTDLIPVEKREGIRDGRETMIEIQVPEAQPELFERREDLEEELLGELRVAQCTEDGETGHGSMGDFSFDIAVTVDTKRFKTAMGIVRRVLKKYKVPESVWIREFRDDLEEPIEHPLIAPPSAK